jgi:hypothetical protein
MHLPQLRFLQFFCRNWPGDGSVLEISFAINGYVEADLGY